MGTQVNGYGAGPQLADGNPFNFTGERCAFALEGDPHGRKCGSAATFKARGLMTALAAGFPLVDAGTALLTCDMHLPDAARVFLGGGLHVTVEQVAIGRYYRCSLASWSAERRGELGYGRCESGDPAHETDAMVRLRQHGAPSWTAYCAAHVSAGVQIESCASDQAGYMGEVHWLPVCEACKRPAVDVSGFGDTVGGQLLCSLCDAERLRSMSTAAAA